MAGLTAPFAGIVLIVLSGPGAFSTFSLGGGGDGAAGCGATHVRYPATAAITIPAVTSTVATSATIHILLVPRGAFEFV